MYPAYHPSHEERLTMKALMATRAVVLMLALAAGTRAAADETYVGTVAVPQAAAPIPLTLTIHKYTSDERANQLAQLLHDRGHKAAVASLASDDVGQLALGDGSYRVTLIRQEPTEGGRILRIVTDRPVQAPKSAAAAPAEAVGYLELKLGAGDAGGGRLLPAVTAAFDADGFVAPDNVGHTSWVVSEVKRRP
jgi:hypothetical protein